MSDEGDFRTAPATPGLLNINVICCHVVGNLVVAQVYLEGCTVLSQLLKVSVGKLVAQLWCTFLEATKI